ncbi:diphosphomevalonate decarboxylase [Gracilimonas sp. Q87]|uniref:diphosphomevalonate decarboxylase n=1 Tax=Gracilimonas sp. Q87 TaxID=3384766 RepID=UPI0039844CA7
MFIKSATIFCVTKTHSVIKKFSSDPITAVAHSNIALIKYWGKRSVDYNLPAVGSISLTLDALYTRTTLQFMENLDSDQLMLNKRQSEGEPLKRVSDFLDIVAGSDDRPNALIKSDNNFPTGAGLASSASGFAALALAAAKGFELALSKEELSQLARIGSGSAARSICGGFSQMKLGTKDDGSEDFAISLFNEKYWDIRLLVAVTSDEKKELGSTEGMMRTANTAPYYDSWVKSHPKDLEDMKQALAAKDFEKTGNLTEHSCFKMHGLVMAANPPILYWNAATTETIHRVWNLRRNGIQAYVTIDAGPQVKILCLPESVKAVRDALTDIEGVRSVIEAKPGPGAYITDTVNEMTI